MADPTPPVTPPAPAETTEQKAARLVEGNPLEFDKVLANATPTEKAILDAAKKAYDAKYSGKTAAFTFAGVPGGAFNIDGSGFGSAPGSVMVNGQPVQTTRWSDHTIRGMLPANAAHGPVVINHSGGTTLNGAFGPAVVAPAAPVKK
jgi:hypothetical protein